MDVYIHPAEYYRIATNALALQYNNYNLINAMLLLHRNNIVIVAVYDGNGVYSLDQIGMEIMFANTERNICESKYKYNGKTFVCPDSRELYCDLNIKQKIMDIIQLLAYEIRYN